MLFVVASLSLMSQTLRECTGETDVGGARSQPTAYEAIARELDFVVTDVGEAVDAVRSYIDRLAGA